MTISPSAFTSSGHSHSHHSEALVTDKNSIFSQLNRLSRFGANILDAYSCFIFLPSSLVRDLFRSDNGTNSPVQQSGIKDSSLMLCGAHSLCTELTSPCVVTSENSLVGWVASHHKPIVLAPFERQSSILGTYKKDQDLKSVVATPFTAPTAVGNAGPAHTALSGVILCDSKKSFAFTKLQIKLLEELGLEITALLQLMIAYQTTAALSQSWEEFLNGGLKLLQSVGAASLEAVRLVPQNLHEIERALGTKRSADFIEQIYRLLAQAVPPHYPLYKSSAGDLIILVDHMMSQVYLNKIDTLLERMPAVMPSGPSRRIEFSIHRQLLNPKQMKELSLESLILSTLPVGPATTAGAQCQDKPFLKKLINF